MHKNCVNIRLLDLCRCTKTEIWWCLLFIRVIKMWSCSISPNLELNACGQASFTLPQLAINGYRNPLNHQFAYWFLYLLHLHFLLYQSLSLSIRTAKKCTLHQRGAPTTPEPLSLCTAVAIYSSYTSSSSHVDHHRTDISNIIKYEKDDQWLIYSSYVKTDFPQCFTFQDKN